MDGIPKEGDHYVLDIGTAPDLVGVAVWATIEGKVGEPFEDANLYQLVVTLKQGPRQEDRQELVDIDNIDISLESYPGLLALAQQAWDALPEKEFSYGR